MRLLHRFLCWFPLWAFGTLLALVAIAVAAAQVWPRARAWDEVQYGRACTVVREPAFWIYAIIIAVLWGILTWFTWPARKRASSGWTDRSLAGLDRLMSAQPIRASPHFELGFMEAFRRSIRGLPPEAPIAEREGGAVKRDKPLGEALAYLACGEWGHDIDYAIVDMFQEGSRDLFGEFRQRAFDDKITVWGRHNRQDVYRIIPAEYWSNHQIDGKALLNGFVRTWGNDGNGFIDLMLSKVEVEEWANG